MNAIDEKIKEELQMDISLSIRKRKLAHGDKKYFVVSIMCLNVGTSPFYVLAKEVIRKYYPNCGLTSCGMSSATIAEY